MATDNVSNSDQIAADRPPGLRTDMRLRLQLVGGLALLSLYEAAYSRWRRLEDEMYVHKGDTLRANRLPRDTIQRAASCSAMPSGNGYDLEAGVSRHEAMMECVSSAAEREWMNPCDAVRECLALIYHGMCSMLPYRGYDLEQVHQLFSLGDDWSEEQSALQMEFIQRTLLPYLSSHGELTAEFVKHLVRAAEQVFTREDTVGAVSVSSGEAVTVVGDIHGNLHDLETIFRIRGFPSVSNKFIFNGDIVDRGERSVACLVVILALKITYPHAVFVNRGNHESKECEADTFFDECRAIDPSDRLYSRCQMMFCSIPIAHVINDGVFVVHGGIPRDVDVCKMHKWDRMNPRMNVGQVMHQCMWNDPHTGLDMVSSSRGLDTWKFGSDITEEFLRRNKLDLLVRSHEFTRGGFKTNHDEKCLTVFSASNYQNLKNDAAVLVFTANHEWRVVRYGWQ